MSDEHAPTVQQSLGRANAETVPAVRQRAVAAAESASQALPVGFRLDEFEIQAKLGEGGFGIVYRCWDHSLGQMRAIKEYMPSAMAQRDGTQVVSRNEQMSEPFSKGLQRFVEEAQTLARFDHPSLVRVLRRWEANGTAYMAMPLYEGKTLREHIRGLPETPKEDWLLALLDPLTEAMGVVHRNRWLHRDIAPDNIWLLKDSGRPLLLDFGAARQVIGDVTQELTAILKPGFAPVEQYGEVPGGLEQGPWTDVYALAATLHWAILGKTPLPSVTRVLVDKQVPLVESAKGRYSEGFLAALDKALRVDARKRTQSMAEFRVDLGLDLAADVQTLPMSSPVIAAAPAWSPTQKHSPDPAEARTVQMTEVRTELKTALLEREAAPAPHAPTRAVPRPIVEAIAEPMAADPLAEPAAKRDRSGLYVALAAGGLLVAAGAAYLTRSPAPSPAQAVQAPAPMVAAAPAPVLVAAPASAVTAAPPPPFSMDGELQALVEQADPAYAIEVGKLPKALSIARRDDLRFTLRSARDGYLTLLLRGPDGSLTLMGAPPLKVKAGQTLQWPLPGQKLEAQEPVGTEDLVVLVSAAPRDFATLASGPAEGGAQELRTGDAAAKLRAAWSGPGPWLAGRCGAAACDYGAVRFKVEVTR